MDKDHSKKNSKILFISDYCYTPRKRIVNATILCKNEKITAIGNASAFSPDPNLLVYDLRGTYAVPGFIDSHIHGAGGFDSSTVDEGTEDFRLMCKTLASHGVTSFLPTIVSRPTDKLLASISSLGKLINKNHLGAEPLGIRLEGPYISKVKCGSQNKKFARPIDLGELKEIIAAGEGQIKIMTFAPELDNSIKLVEILKENDIVPSMGHTEADVETVQKAIEAGVVHCTHVCNGMPPLHHREVGIAAVALTDDRVSVEIILDAYHIHPRMIDIICRTKPRDKIIGVSDAIQAAGLPDGTYHLGKTQVKVTDGRVVTEEGTIAGTTLTLEKGWDHLVRYSQLDIKDAAACLTENPARLLNLEKIGELSPGRNADIAFFNSENNTAVLTVRDGKIVYIDKTQAFNIHKPAGTE